MSICACNNCAWVGYKIETVHPKHLESVSLCPNCKETTEEVTPSWFNEIREDAKHKDNELKKTVNIEVIHDQGARIIVFEEAIQSFIDEKEHMHGYVWNFQRDWKKRFKPLLSKKEGK